MPIFLSVQTIIFVLIDKEVWIKVNIRGDEANI